MNAQACPSLAFPVWWDWWTRVRMRGFQGTFHVAGDKDCKGQEIPLITYPCLGFYNVQKVKVTGVHGHISGGGWVGGYLPIFTFYLGGRKNGGWACPRSLRVRLL